MIFLNVTGYISCSISWQCHGRFCTQQPRIHRYGNNISYTFSIAFTLTLIFFFPNNYVGHIQISQIPDRSEPSDDGTIKFSSFFKGIEEAGYDGWVAGEYFATGERTVSVNDIVQCHAISVWQIIPILRV